jgi:hypothetical protein
MTAVRRSAPSRKDEDMFVVAVHGIKFLKRKLRVGETGYEFCLVRRVRISNRGASREQFLQTRVCGPALSKLLPCGCQEWLPYLVGGGPSLEDRLG